MVREGPDAPLLPGRVGHAIQAGDQQKLSIQVVTGAEAEPFPISRGSVVMWLRPDQPLGAGSQRLMFGSWAAFELAIEGDRLLAYATSNSQHFLAGSLSVLRDTWPANWHLVVMTWDGTNRQLFVDGKLLASRTDAAPLATSPTNIRIGFLPAAGSNPDRAHFQGALDEFAILKTALTAEAVEGLYRSGIQADARGVLEVLGGAVVIWTDRLAWLRGEVARLSIAPYTTGRSLRIEAVPVDDEQAAPIPVWEGEVSIRGLDLDTRDLRPGVYRLQAKVLSSDGTSVTFEDGALPIRVLAQRSPDLPVGLDGLVSYPDAVLRQASSWGLSFVSSGVFPWQYLESAVDRLMFQGLGYFPNLNVHDHRVMALDRSAYFDENGKGNQRLADEVLQGLVLQDDLTFARYSSSLGSPFSPVAREAMRAHVKRFVEAADGHPGLLAMSFDDEYEFRIGTDGASGLRYLGDYSAAARAYFTGKSGLPPAFPPVAQPGTVLADSHPYFRWRDLMGMPGDPSAAGLEMSWADLAVIAKGIRPDVAVTTWSGGETGRLDAVMDYAYPAIWQPSFGYPNGHGRLDFLFDRHRARQQGSVQKPVWALLGWWSDDLRAQPDWVVQDLRLNTVMALAKGARLINWHSSWLKPTDPALMGTGLLSREDTRAEMARLAAQIREEGSMYARLESRRDGRVAVLISDDDRVGKLQTQNQALAYNWFYPAIRLAGYPVDLVTDDMVEAGALDRYDALVLGDFDFASESLWTAIKGYAGTSGKSVFVDQGTSLVPQGAVILPFHVLQSGDPHGRHPQHEMQPLGYMVWMARILRTTLEPKLGPPRLSVAGSDYVAPFFLYGGDGRLLTLVNYNIDQAESVTVTLTGDGPSYVYDMDSGALVAQANAAGQVISWSTTVPTAGASRYVVLGQAISSVDASLVEEGGDFVVRAAVLGGNGTRIRFPLPLSISIQDPQRRPVPAYGRYAAVDPTTGSLELRFPKSRLMDGSGAWSVNVRELVTRIAN